MQKKLLIFHPYLATYRVDTYNSLNKDFQVKVILTGHPEELSGLGYNLTEVNSRAEFDYRYYNNGHYFGRQQITSIYFKAIIDFKPDIVLCHEYGFNTLAAILLKPLLRYKLYLTCDDSLQMAQSYSKKRKLLRNLIERNADGFLVVSTKTERYLENLYTNTKCRFIYFPIIQNDEILSRRISESKNKGISYIQKYNLYSKKIILFVGRFDPMKNIPLLIEAYSRVKSANNVLILVGDGEGKEIVTNIIEQLQCTENIIQTGALYENDLYAWFNIADIFVLPSKQEPFGAVVNEALVGGCFVIVSDHAGSHTLIQDGSNGLIFESGMVSDLTKKLNEALSMQKKDSCTNKMTKTFSAYYSDLINEFNS